MLGKVCREVKNWFEIEKVFDTFTIQGGILITPLRTPLKENQYFRIVGSIFNDGVYKNPTDKLTDETFTGAIWRLAIPKDFLDLVDEITTWGAQYGGNSPFTSESFGGYSYTKKQGSDTWQGAFKDKLNKWRKV